MFSCELRKVLDDFGRDIDSFRSKKNEDFERRGSVGSEADSAWMNSTQEGERQMGSRESKEVIGMEIQTTQNHECHSRKR